jgi:hypothetical protein
VSDLREREHKSEAERAFMEAIELGIEERGPYPEGAVFIDAGSPVPAWRSRARQQTANLSCSARATAHGRCFTGRIQRLRERASDVASVVDRDGRGDRA